jgi:RNA polymerase sigma-70 factor (ECF subfamily)
MGSEPGNVRTEDLLDHATWIRVLARRLVTDDAAAEDVEQETWLAALRRPPKADRPLEPWLARVIRNQAALRVRRRRGRRAREREVARSEVLPSASELVERAEVQRKLVEAVVGLDDPYRSTLLLHYYEGLTAAEIARRRGIPAATVRTHLKRGHEKVRQKLDREHRGRDAWATALIPLIEHVPMPAPESATAATASGAAVGGIGASAWVLAGAAAILATVGLFWRFNRPVEAASEPVAAVALGEAQPTHAARDEPELGFASSAPTSARAGVELDTPAPSGHIALLLVDRETERPLPGYAMRVTTPAGSAFELTTDARGRFQPGVEIEEGHHALLLLDDTRLARIPARRSLYLQPGDGVITVAVATGPTVRLALESAGGELPRELRARLAEREAPVRWEGGEGPWVRFPPLASDAPGQLEVFSADGLFAGAADWTAEADEEPVAVVLASAAALRGVVRDEGGPVTADVELELVSLGGDGGDARVARTNELGRFLFGVARAGDALLRVRSPRHHPVELPVYLVNGAATVREIELLRRARAGLVSGMLASRTGRYDEPVELLLHAADGTSMHEHVRWTERRGELVAEFAFENVPPGRYELCVVPVHDQLSWTSRCMTVFPPVENLVLECFDEAHTADLRLRARDAKTGSEVALDALVYAVGEGREVALEADGAGWSLYAEGRAWTSVEGPLEMRGVPTDAGLTWAAYADGYVPAYGDELTFAAGEQAEIELRPGWGARVQVTAADAADANGHFAPLPGVTVLDGDEVLARTDGDGWVQLELGARPERLRFEKTGLQATHGDFDPESGHLRGERLVYRVRMVPSK